MELLSLNITNEGNVRILLNPQLADISDNIENCITDEEMEVLGVIAVNMCSRLGLVEEVEE